MSNLSEKMPDCWFAPNLPQTIHHGDMPGDKIVISEDHILKATLIFPELLKVIKQTGKEKVVISVYGGSGVGKSEIASLLAYYFGDLSIGTYILSGDNYPYRIPKFNDLERERVFATKGVEGLREYLGSEYEINYKEVNEILRQFHDGRATIYLRRMGREPEELWYEEVPFDGTQILILEWTHGNNSNLTGVDIPIFLNSTPEETLEHRRKRNRDGAVDSPFTTMVLTLEQELLASQRPTAKISVAKGGFLECISF